MKIHAFLVSMCALFCPTTGYAIDGNALLEFCNGSNRAACLAYVEGVYMGQDTVLLIGTKSFDAYSRIRVICIPENATVGQTADVVAKGLRDRPEARHNRAAALVVSILMGAFPCEPSSPSR